VHSLRGRRGPFAGAFVALTVAAALVMACATLMQAGLGADAAVERYAGTPFVIAGEQKATINAGSENQDTVPLYERARLDAALVSKVAAVEGVDAAIGDSTTPADLYGPHGMISGPGDHEIGVHPWASAALTPYALLAGHAPAAARDLIVDAGLARRGGLHVGDRVRLSSNAPARSMIVAGIARTAVNVERQGVLFVTSAVAAQLARTPGRVDAIGVLPERGADMHALREQLGATVAGRARVVTGATRGEVEHLEVIEAREAVIAIGGTFGGLALLIAMFVVSSTIGLAIAQRQREIALLRAIAATPRQVRRLVGRETLLVALAASLTGILPGAALAGALGHALTGHGIAPEGMKVELGLIPALIAVAGCVVTAQAAVIAAGRRAARVRPTEALQQSASEPRMLGVVRFTAGAVAAVGALVLASLCGASQDPDTASGVAAGASMTMVIAVALLGPLLVRIAARLGRGVVGRGGRVGGFLALSNMRTSSRRFSSAVTPLVLTVAVSSSLVFLNTTRQHAAEDQGAQRVIADLVLTSDGVGIPRSEVDDARRIPGVTATVATATTTIGPSLGSRYRETAATMVDPEGAGRVLDLDVREGSLAALRDHTIAVSDAQAKIGRVAVGDRVLLTMGDGAHERARIVATYKRALGFGDVVLPTSLAAAHRTSPLLDSVLLRTTPGASAGAVARLKALATRYPGLQVGTQRDLAVRVDRNREADDWLMRILSVILFAFTAIAVVNTLMMIGLHRARELALLRLVGATSRQIRAMARWEGAAIVTLGVGLGTGIALVTLMPSAALLSGSPMPYAPAGLVALVLGSAAAVGFLGSILASRLAMRTRPMDAIAVRD
jgi:putative ABC transport system permease protein